MDTKFKEHDEKNVSVQGAKCVKHTMRAILVELDGKQFWIPQTQVHADSEVYTTGDKGKLVISKWVAIERGFWEKES